MIVLSDATRRGRRRGNGGRSERRRRNPRDTGIRHALPAVPALGLCAALAVHKTIASRSLVLRVTVFLATGKVSRQQRGFEPVRMPPPS